MSRRPIARIWPIVFGAAFAVWIGIIITALHWLPALLKGAPAWLR